MFSFLLGAQNNLRKTNSKEVKWELARIIEMRVIIRDTTRIGTVLAQYDSTTMLNEYVDNNFERFIEPSSFYQLKNSIYKIVNSKNAIVYGNSGKRLNQQEIKDTYCVCDSVDVLNCFGKEGDYMIWHCDSVEKINSISAIDFYEKWSFNEQDKMIEKVVLAYRLLYYDSNKELFAPLFMVFRDEQAIKTYWGEH